MADAKAIADEAMRLARQFLDDARSRIVELSEGDLNALYDASQIVRTEAVTPAGSPHAIEHLAFSLITAAHLATKESGSDRPVSE